MNSCEQKCKKSSVPLKAVGLILMGLGLIMVLLSVPLWFWWLILGVALVVGGFLLWRYSA